VIALRRTAGPSSLNGAGSAGAAERTAALEFFADPANTQRKFTFRAYASPDVKAALRAICGVKCAYCEADVASGGPTDTEHFRPKGAIKIAGKNRKPGYYWLAGDWANLLPSCRDCNSPRYQETPTGRRLVGKGNQFPLVDEAAHATAPGGELLEEPLLLDPFTDDPEAHLEFLAEGAIRPATDGQGTPSPRGAKTIEVLGLDRIDLCTVRTDQGIVIGRAIRHFRRAAKRVEAEPANPDAEEDLEEEMKELRRLVDPATRFAALARQMIARDLGAPLLELLI
jgi:uncharacterized protein (TIGR02646 family)